MQHDQGLGRFIENVIGPTAPLLGVVTSFQEQLEWGMRMVSLIIGILIGLVHLYRVVRRK